jgi:hypothetical protein
MPAIPVDSNVLVYAHDRGKFVKPRYDTQIVHEAARGMREHHLCLSIKLGIEVCPCLWYYGDML